MGSSEASSTRTALRPFATGSGPKGTFQTSRTHREDVTIIRLPSADIVGASNDSATFAVNRLITPV